MDDRSRFKYDRLHERVLEARIRKLEEQVAVLEALCGVGEISKVK
jgi:hypothetical protein